MELEILKRSLFEAYSAGFEAGMAQSEDIVTAYEKWWENIMESVRKEMNYENY